MWAYSRIDTIRDAEQLKLIKSAGIHWLCLGIESGDKKVRLEVTKGKFEDVDIREVIKMSHDNGVEIIGNYLFGLTGDTKESMQKTLDLSLELCTVAWNAYAVMALPGSSLYRKALNSGHKLPSSYEGYSFHAYDTLPLPTDTLSPGEILKFRDEAFHIYHTNKLEFFFDVRFFSVLFIVFELFAFAWLIIDIIKSKKKQDLFIAL